jgi:hypothetical protein
LIPGNYFDRFKELKQIDLDYNQLEHLHRDTFKDNLKLTHIRLSGIRNFKFRDFVVEP